MFCRTVDADRYNRSVGQCIIENTDIGLAMLRAGQAEAMLRYLPRNHGIDIAEYGYAEAEHASVYLEYGRRTQRARTYRLAHAFI
ncbi:MULTISPECIES: thermonuclease family protein [Brucella]|uniref:TNase-like domain-containing protein n=1 Tax=Brucella pseudogrignonensis TaxID=419475 RepID=A0A256G7E8_9HYPH|nr:thermonuclease family protein [Brucella pseudogrignonensis]OYR22886.1 hypothetical protein CEV34_4084 [Brucella pseudogrignonensis]